MIVLKNIFKSYKKKEKDFFVLKDINLSLEKGVVHALVGRNGSGKTTIIRLIRKIIPNYQGTIEINGKNIKLYNEYLNTFFFMDAELESIRLISNFEELFRILDFFNDYYISSENFKQTSFFKNYLSDINEKSNLFFLSTGLKKRILLSKLFMMKKVDFLILDEPFEGLDIEIRDVFINKIKELVKQGAGVLIISHNFNDLEILADKLIILDEGRIKFFDEKRNQIKSEWDLHVEIKNKQNF